MATAVWRTSARGGLRLAGAYRGDRRAQPATLDRARPLSELPVASEPAIQQRREDPVPRCRVLGETQQAIFHDGRALRKKRIVLTSFGSLGDRHPYIAVALGLQNRGHDNFISTSEYYPQKIEALGLDFHAVRPDLPYPPDLDFMHHVMDRHKGTEVVMRELMMPAVGHSYGNLLAAAEGADLLVSHPLTYATRLVAEKMALPWAPRVLQPILFMSVHNPPILPSAPRFSKFPRALGPSFHRHLYGFGKYRLRTWTQSWHALWAEIDLAQVAKSPTFEG
jgi:hypothetical protein